jgi:hypothetical protein
LIADVQPYLQEAPPKAVYKALIGLLPKSRTFLKYMKAASSEKYEDWLVKLVMRTYEVSDTEAEEYLKILYSTKTGKEHIKEIAESAEIDGIEYIETTKGGLTVEVKKYRYELVFTHTARRSFCTNAYLKGMPSIDIMQISGHKTETAFMKYIKVTKEQVAERMSIHPFFTDSHLKVV